MTAASPALGIATYERDAMDLFPGRNVGSAWVGKRGFD
jgi:hypothetical protein